RISLRGPPRGGRARSVLVFRPAAIIAPEVRGRDTAQIGHRGVALSPALAALSTSETQFGLASRQTHCRCPLWVTSGHHNTSAQCPPCPESGHSAPSSRCQ